jgi:acyl-CoA reductase-like NAD-dependent aldehyde dehydrogenase|tara:strand:+ start:211 stop:402 length:192 start_codon:yes stop_codon:yes gene_type:complete
MLIVDEEQFGPVLPLIKCSDIDDVINAANNSLSAVQPGLINLAPSSQMHRSLALNPRFSRWIR